MCDLNEKLNSFIESESEDMHYLSRNKRLTQPPVDFTDELILTKEQSPILKKSQMNELDHLINSQIQPSGSSQRNKLRRSKKVFSPHAAKKETTILELRKSSRSSVKEPLIENKIPSSPANVPDYNKPFIKSPKMINFHSVRNSVGPPDRLDSSEIEDSKNSKKGN